MEKLLKLIGRDIKDVKIDEITVDGQVIQVASYGKMNADALVKGVASTEFYKKVTVGEIILDDSGSIINKNKLDENVA